MILPESELFKAPHIGLSLHPTCIRGIQVDQNNKVIQSAQADLPQNYIQSEAVDAKTLTQGLLDVYDKGKFSTKHAAVCIPEKYAYSRKHTLPAINLSEVDEAIKWQIESIFPFSKKEIYFDWKLITSSKDKVEVLVTAVQKNLLDALQQSFEAAGLVPICFEPSASAVIRLVPESDRNQLIISELDPIGTASTIIHNGAAVMTATTHFNSNTQPQIVLNDITNTIKSLIARIESSDQEWQMILTGEKASDQIAQVLSDHLEIPVKTLSIDQINSSMHLAYTMSIAQVYPPRDTNTINLLPANLETTYQQQSDMTLTSKALTIITALSLVSLIISLIVAGSSYLAVSQEKTRIEQLQEQISSQAQPINIPQVTQVAQRITNLFPLKSSPVNELLSIASMIPEGITTQSVFIDMAKKQAGITGISYNRADLLTLRTQLEELDEVSNVTLPLSSLAAPGQTEFTLDIRISESED